MTEGLEFHSMLKKGFMISVDDKIIYSRNSNL